MKNLVYILLIGVLSFNSSFAQQEIDVNLRVLPPYSLKLEHYENFEGVVLDIRNTTNATQEIKFKVSLTSDEGLSAETDFNNVLDPFILEPNEMMVLSGSQIEDLGIQFDQDDFNLLGLPPLTVSYIELTRQLPEGNYTLCVQAFDFNTEEALSNNAPDGCDSWVLVQPERPQILLPTDGSEVAANETDNVTFLWTPVNAGVQAPGQMEYDLRVVDLEGFEGQPTLLTVLDQASDYTLYERGLSSNEYTLNSGDYSEEINLIEGHRYAVLVTAIDPENELPEQFQNHSDVITFVYGEEGVGELASAPEIRSPDEDENKVDGFFSWYPPDRESNLPFPELVTKLMFIEQTDGVDIEIGEFQLIDETSIDGSPRLEILGNHSTWIVGEQSTENKQINYFGPEIEFKHGSRYAMLVFCQFGDGGEDYPQIENGGKSEVVHFTYGKDDNQEPEGNVRTLTFGVGPQVTYDEGDVTLLPDDESGGSPSDNGEDQDSGCDGDCTYTLAEAEKQPSTTLQTEIISNKGDVFQLGKFDVDVITMEESAGTISGTGTVKVDLLMEVQIKIAFSNVKINENGRAYQGSAQAVKDVQGFSLGDWGLTGDKTGGLLDEGMASLNEVLEGNGDIADQTSEVRVITRFFTGEPMGLPLGVDREIDGYKVLLGFTQMSFTTERANCTIAAEFSMPPELMKGGTGKFGLKGSDICLIPGGFGQEFTLHLSEDLTIPIDGDEAIVIKGDSGGDKQNILDKATYLEVDCNGLKGFAMRFEMAFPDDVLVLDQRLLGSGNPNDGVVNGRFGFSYRRGANNNTENLANTEKSSQASSSNFNFIINFDMDPFQIKGLDGWGFSLQEGHIDLSTLDNPSGMNFPVGYDFGPDGNLENTWQGFYLKKISVRVPDDMLKDEANIQSNIEIGLQDIIYDGQFSAEIFAKDILEITEDATSEIAAGSVNGWGISIEEFSISILQNDFQSGSLKGDFKLPVQEKGGSIEYEAILGFDNAAKEDESKWGFVFNIEVKDKPIVLPLMIAEAEIAEASYVHLMLGEVAGDPRKAEGQSFHIHGKLNIGGDLIDADIMKKMESVLSMEGVKYGLKYTQNDGWDEELCTISFASPQKFISTTNTDGEGEGGVGGFPITLTNFGVEDILFDQEEGEDKDKYAAKFNFTIGVNFMDDEDGGISASADMSLVTGWDGQNESFMFEDFSISCVSINSEIDGVELGGRVCFYSNEPPPGCPDAPPSDGVRGSLYVGLPVAQVNLNAEFGIAKPPGEESYRYWSVDGKVIISSGISLGTVSLYGLSGGIYYNMAPVENKQTINNITIDKGSTDEAKAMGAGLKTAPENSEEAEKEKAEQLAALDDAAYKEALNSSPQMRSQQFCPQKDSYVFKAGLVLGLSGEPSTFNMDVGVTVAINKDGLSMFDITGNGYIMADFDERDDAYVVADLKITFQRTNCDVQYGCDESFSSSFAIYAELNLEEFLQVQGIGVAPYTGDIGKGESSTTIGGQTSYKFLEAAFSLDIPKNDGEVLWKFTMGTPQAPGGLIATVTMPGNEDTGEDAKVLAQAVSKFYLMVGNHGITPGFMDAPPLIARLLTPGKSSTSGESGSISEGAVMDVETGRMNPQALLNALSKPDPKTGKIGVAGFGMGFNFALDIDLDFFLIYASLKAAAGFDLNMIKPEGGILCQNFNSDGSIGTKKFDGGGANGFYSTGRVYAGIEGELGLKIELMGNEAKFVLLRLGAAFMVEGGFPDPTWIQGTAAVQYEVMGGMIAGEARFDFKAGDVCIPPITNPFGFEIIEEIIPDDGQDQVSVIANPEITFNIPMNELQTYEIITLDEDENIITDFWNIMPYIDEIKIKEGSNTIGHLTYDAPTNVSQTYGALQPKTKVNVRPDWQSNKTHLTLVTSESLEPETEYTITLKLKGVQFINGDGELKVIRVPNEYEVMEDWSEIREVTFTTGVMPLKIPDEYLLYTNPMPNQRYFLKNENSGTIVFNKKGLANSYFNHDNEGEDISSYVARFTNEYNGEVVESPISNFSNKSINLNRCKDKSDRYINEYNCNSWNSLNTDEVKFGVPAELSSDCIYKLEVVAKIDQSSGTNAIWSSLGGEGNAPIPSYLYERLVQQQRLGIDTLFNDISQKITAEKLDKNKVHTDELIIFSSYFGVSMYNTLSEKLAASQVEEIASQVKVTNSVEPFDKVDVYGQTKRNLSRLNASTSSELPVLLPLVGIESSVANSKYASTFSSLAYAANKNKYSLGITWTGEYRAYFDKDNDLGFHNDKGNLKITLTFDPRNGSFRLKPEYSATQSWTNKIWKSMEKIKPEGKPEISSIHDMSYALISDERYKNGKKPIKSGDKVNYWTVSESSMNGNGDGSPKFLNAFNINEFIPSEAISYRHSFKSIRVDPTKISGGVESLSWMEIYLGKPNEFVPPTPPGVVTAVPASSTPNPPVASTSSASYSSASYGTASYSNLGLTSMVSTGLAMTPTLSNSANATSLITSPNTVSGEESVIISYDSENVKSDAKEVARFIDKLFSFLLETNTRYSIPSNSTHSNNPNPSTFNSNQSIDSWRFVGSNSTTYQNRVFYFGNPYVTAYNRLYQAHQNQMLPLSTLWANKSSLSNNYNGTHTSRLIKRSKNKPHKMY